jgi:hypothetical protein
MIGSVLNYAFTGQGPQDLRDAFFPRTGGKDENGNPKRVSLPTYMKDIYHFGVEPLKTLGNKIHPTLQLIHEMLTNRDFYGVEIRNADDPIVQQIGQEMQHVIGSLEPLSSRNLRRGLALGETPAEAARNLVGITPAPARMNQTPAEQAAADLITKKLPAGARAHEAAKKSARDRALRGQMRQGNPAALQEALRSGIVAKNEARTIVRQAKQSPLEGQISRLSTSDALKIWGKASREEQQAIRIEMIKKLRGARGSVPAAEFNSLAAQYRKAGILQ